MREVAFIKQNKEKWLELEQALQTGFQENPDKLSKLFIKVNNDLAYAQTYYPKSRVIDYLNHLCSTTYHKVYRKKSYNYGFKDFWLFDVPMLMYLYRNYFYFAFALFFLFVAIGVFSSIYEPEFVRQILGDGYVDETENNIRNGDPLAIYNNQTLVGDFNSFYRILYNNFRVGILAFSLGLIAGVGSIFILLQNGIMVGSFQYMFYEYDHFGLSLRTIWIHGAMELFGACIEVGAGVLVGTAWLFPGHLSRWKAFLHKGKAGLKIFISTFPFTLSAAFLEGFVTQYANEMHWIPATLIVISTLTLITYYYIIYPFKVNRKTKGHHETLLTELAYVD